MTAQERILQWDQSTPAWRRKEIYENLMGIPEFSDFLGLMREYQISALKRAQYEEKEEIIRYYLGSASTIDDLIQDMVAVEAAKSAE